MTASVKLKTSFNIKRTFKSCSSQLDGYSRWHLTQSDGDWGFTAYGIIIHAWHKHRQSAFLQYWLQMLVIWATGVEQPSSDDILYEASIWSISELIWLLPISYSVNFYAGPRVDGSIFLCSNISSLQWIIYCYCHMMGDNNVAPTACH